MNKIFKTYNIQINILSPVHIGSGEEYIPTDYVIRDKHLMIFNREKFIDKLIAKNQYDKFLKLCDQGDILKIRDFVFDNVDNSLIEQKIEVSEEIERKYKGTLKNPAQYEGAYKRKKVINALEIRKFTYSTFENRLIIPGSSVKGAIRTAVLDYFGKKKNFRSDLAKKDRNDRNLQKYLLDITERDTSDDPFRLIKISDFKLQQGGSFIDFIYNIKNFSDSSSKVPVKMEILKPNSIFTGTIQIHNKSRIKIEDILNWCNLHYFEDTYNFEFDKFNYGSSKLNPDDFNIEQNSFFMKIGQHSGAFAVTLNRYRNENIRHQKLKQTMNHQTTTWKCNKFNMPLGWVRCKILGDNLKAAYEKQNKTIIKKEVSNVKVKKKTVKADNQDLKRLFNKFNKKYS